ncbi:MAG: hypothetical protein JO121_04020 [Deltaproteobacteria bacterium]|nr:hypothetical protein [Deltaproteobacteria bacterium]
MKKRSAPANSIISGSIRSSGFALIHELRVKYSPGVHFQRLLAWPTTFHQIEHLFWADLFVCTLKGACIVRKIPD